MNTVLEWANSMWGVSQLHQPGAIDVIAIRRADGSIVCSPFHVKLGKVSKKGEKKIVRLKVNGKAVDLSMKLGQAGEAFFVQRTRERVRRDNVASPIATGSPKSESPLPRNINIKNISFNNQYKQTTTTTTTTTRSTRTTSSTHERFAGSIIKPAALKASPEKDSGTSESKKKVTKEGKSGTSSSSKSKAIASPASKTSSSQLQQQQQQKQLQAVSVSNVISAVAAKPKAATALPERPVLGYQRARSYSEGASASSATSAVGAAASAELLPVPTVDLSLSLSPSLPSVSAQPQSGDVDDSTTEWKARGAVVMTEKSPSDCLGDMMEDPHEAPSSSSSLAGGTSGAVVTTTAVTTTVTSSISTTIATALSTTVATTATAPPPSAAAAIKAGVTTGSGLGGALVGPVLRRGRARSDMSAFEHKSFRMFTEGLSDPSSLPLHGPSITTIPSSSPTTIASSTTTIAGTSAASVQGLKQGVGVTTADYEDQEQLLLRRPLKEKSKSATSKTAPAGTTGIVGFVNDFSQRYFLPRATPTLSLSVAKSTLIGIDTEGSSTYSAGNDIENAFPSSDPKVAVLETAASPNQSQLPEFSSDKTIVGANVSQHLLDVTTKNSAEHSLTPLLATQERREGLKTPDGTERVASASGGKEKSNNNNNCGSISNPSLPIPFPILTAESQLANPAQSMPPSLQFSWIWSWGSLPKKSAAASSSSGTPMNTQHNDVVTGDSDVPPASAGAPANATASATASATFTAATAADLGSTPPQTLLVRPSHLSPHQTSSSFLSTEKIVDAEEPPLIPATTEAQPPVSHAALNGAAIPLPNIPAFQVPVSLTLKSVSTTGIPVGSSELVVSPLLNDSINKNDRNTTTQRFGEDAENAREDNGGGADTFDGTDGGGDFYSLNASPAAPPVVGVQRKGSEEKEDNMGEEEEEKEEEGDKGSAAGAAYFTPRANSDSSKARFSAPQTIPSIAKASDDGTEEVDIEQQLNSPVTSTVFPLPSRKNDGSGFDSGSSTARVVMVNENDDTVGRVAQLAVSLGENESETAHTDVLDKVESMAEHSASGDKSPVVFADSRPLTPSLVEFYDAIAGDSLSLQQQQQQAPSLHHIGAHSGSSSSSEGTIFAQNIKQRINQGNEVQAQHGRISGNGGASGGDLQESGSVNNISVAESGISGGGFMNSLASQTSLYTTFTALSGGSAAGSFSSHSPSSSSSSLSLLQLQQQRGRSHSAPDIFVGAEAGSAGIAGARALQREDSSTQLGLCLDSAPLPSGSTADRPISAYIHPIASISDRELPGFYYSSGTISPLLQSPYISRANLSSLAGGIANDDDGASDGVGNEVLGDGRRRSASTGSRFEEGRSAHVYTHQAYLHANAQAEQPQQQQQQYQQGASRKRCANMQSTRGNITISPESTIITDATTTTTATTAAATTAATASSSGIARNSGCYSILSGGGDSGSIVGGSGIACSSKNNDNNNRYSLLVRGVKTGKGKLRGGGQGAAASTAVMGTAGVGLLSAAGRGEFSEFMTPSKIQPSDSQSAASGIGSASRGSLSEKKGRLGAVHRSRSEPLVSRLHAQAQAPCALIDVGTVQQFASPRVSDPYSSSVSGDKHVSDAPTAAMSVIQKEANAEIGLITEREGEERIQAEMGEEETVGLTLEESSTHGGMRWEVHAVETEILGLTADSSPRSPHNSATSPHTPDSPSSLKTARAHVATTTVTHTFTADNAVSAMNALIGAIGQQKEGEEEAVVTVDSSSVVNLKGNGPEFHQEMKKFGPDHDEKTESGVQNGNVEEQKETHGEATPGYTGEEGASVNEEDGDGEEGEGSAAAEDDASARSDESDQSGVSLDELIAFMDSKYMENNLNSNNKNIKSFGLKSANTTDQMRSRSTTTQGGIESPLASTLEREGIRGESSAGKSNAAVERTRRRGGGGEGPGGGGAADYTSARYIDSGFSVNSATRVDRGERGGGGGVDLLYNGGGGVGMDGEDNTDHEEGGDLVADQVSLEDIDHDDICPTPAHGDFYESDTDSYLSYDDDSNSLSSFGGTAGESDSMIGNASIAGAGVGEAGDSGGGGGVGSGESSGMFFGSGSMGCDLLADDPRRAKFRRYRFRKVLVPSADHLASLDLRDGENEIVFDLEGCAPLRAQLFVWPEDCKIVVTDLEGVITNPTASKGAWVSFLGGGISSSKLAVHRGSVPLFQTIAEHGYKILYIAQSSTNMGLMSSKEYISSIVETEKVPVLPISHPMVGKTGATSGIGGGKAAVGSSSVVGAAAAAASVTTAATTTAANSKTHGRTIHPAMTASISRTTTSTTTATASTTACGDLTARERDSLSVLVAPGLLEHHLPKGPVFKSPDSLIQAFGAERTDVFKAAALRGVKLLFPHNHNPYHACFTTRDCDIRAFSHFGISEGRRFLVNEKGGIRSMFRSLKWTFPGLMAMKYEIFPELPDSRVLSNASRKAAGQTSQLYSTTSISKSSASQGQIQQLQRQLGTSAQTLSTITTTTTASTINTISATVTTRTSAWSVQTPSATGTAALNTTDMDSSHDATYNSTSDRGDGTADDQREESSGETMLGSHLTSMPPSLLPPPATASDIPAHTNPLSQPNPTTTDTTAAAATIASSSRSAIEDGYNNMRKSTQKDVDLVDFYAPPLPIFAMKPPLPPVEDAYNDFNFWKLPIEIIHDD